MAYLAGLGAVLIGIGLTFTLFPRKDDELRLRAEFLAEDEAPAAAAAAKATDVPAAQPG